MNGYKYHDNHFYYRQLRYKQWKMLYGIPNGDLGDLVVVEWNNRLKGSNQ